MVQRIMTAIIIILIVVPPLLFGGVLLDILIGLIVLLGGFELFKLTPSYRRVPKIFYLLFAAYIYGTIFIPSEFIIPYFGVGMMIIFSIAIFYKNFTSQDSFLLLAIAAMFYIFATSFREIHAVDTRYIWLIIIATYMCDTGAYFVGSFLGKHKLIERVSPKKTIEGAIGGIVVSIISSVVFTYFMFPTADLILVGVAACTLPIVSQIGDLFFSVVKRNHRIKDYSNLFPGHGGVLDRIDSLVFTLVWFYALMVVIL